MITIAFFFSCIALILQGILLPRLSILAFAPYLALVVMRSKVEQALILGALAGTVVDVFSEDPMGLHALNYTISVWLLFKIKNHFSHEHSLHLSVFTVFISSLITLLQLVLLFLFDRRVPFDGRWIVTDLIGMPVIDGLYAFVWFAAPLSLLDKLKKMWVLFWLKKKNPSRTSP